MAKNLFGIVLAGGTGSRLWPLSRELFPKQLLNLCNDSEKTLFQQALESLIELVKPENVLIVSNLKLETDLKRQHKELFENDNHCPFNILIEPVAKNTSAAIVSSLLYVSKKKVIDILETTFFVLPSDHLILNKQEFLECLQKAIDLADKGYIVTLGIKPVKPETGYGYIIANDNIDEYSLKAEKFIEKPDINKAKTLIEQNNVFWNSGIFVFKGSIFIEEFKKYNESFYTMLSNLSFTKNTMLYEEYKELPESSIDYSMMEKTDKLAIIPAQIGWSDLGSWYSVYANSTKDENNNFILGNVISRECKNSFIYSNDNLIAAIGLENQLVVNTEDATLVCDIKEAGEIKQIVSELKERKDDTYKIHKTQLRSWGYITLLKQGKGYNIRNLCIKPGAQTSLHMHFHKNKHWTIVEGVAKIVIEEKEYYFMAGQSIDIWAQEMHQALNPGEVDLIILEIQTGDYLIDEDIARFE